MYASWTTEEFALGTINGDAMTDVMEDSVTDFVFGCTKQSTHLPLGSIGFDSSPESLPSQLPLVKGPGMPNFYGYRYVNLEDRNQDLMGMVGRSWTPGMPGFTYVDNSIFGQVADELVNQMGEYKRAANQGVLGPCFSTVGVDVQSVPGLGFVFDGGAKMVFPPTNYFLYDDKVNALTSRRSNIELNGGPKIIIGNYLLTDFHLEFDLKRMRLGFKQENCD
ncbi:hypothetical protein ACE6H2_024036 [Prunus campanulata]